MFALPTRVCHAVQDFLHQLWTLHRDEFHRRFGTAGLEDFWNQVREDDPRLQEHPLLHKEDYKQKCLPGRLHGDKVPYGKRKGASADVSSWSIMTAVGTVWRTLNAWMIVPEGAKYKGAVHDTEKFLEKWRVWDMACCARGKFLQVDPWGEPLSKHGRTPVQGDICGGYYIGWFQIAADHEYLCNYLKLPHWNAERPCAFCPCSDRTVERMHLKKALLQKNART